MEDLVRDLRRLAANARVQLAGMTPRHQRFAHYSEVARVSDAAADALEQDS